MRARELLDSNASLREVGARFEAGGVKTKLGKSSWHDESVRRLNQEACAQSQSLSLPGQTVLANCAH